MIGCQRGRRAWVLVVLLALGAARAGEGAGLAAWLDEPSPAPWNQPRMAVRRAPVETGNEDPRCRQLERRPETPEDRAVTRAGWRLFRDYQAGWGAKVIWALVAHDGMCRPMAYQAFVFLGGRFAGTASPAPMASRTDGSLTAVHLMGPPVQGGSFLSATFLRYTDQDPLCCPSRTTTVRYRVEQRDGAPVLAPAGLDTLPVSR